MAQPKPKVEQKSPPQLDDESGWADLFPDVPPQSGLSLGQINKFLSKSYSNKPDVTSFSESSASTPRGRLLGLTLVLGFSAFAWALLIILLLR